MSATRLVPEEEVRVGDQELPHNGDVLTDLVLLGLWLPKQTYTGRADRGSDQVSIGHGDLKVDAAAKRRFERSGDPVSADSDLLKHDVRRPVHYVGEFFFRPGIPDLEPAD